LGETLVDMRIGVDVGGTFTDAVLIEGSSLWTAKSATTANFVDGVLAACELAARRSGRSLPEVLPRVSRFGLGTTAVTNAITARRGVRVGLLITKGFEETLHLSRGHVVHHDLRLSHGFEAADIEDIAGIDERIDRHGTVLKPLAIAEVESAVERLVAQGIEALAVSFLWSIVNPAHEEEAAAAIARRWPELPITIGSRLLPVPREYERTTLAVLNAYVSAACTGVEELGRRLADRGLSAPLLLVHSGGGTISVAEAQARPVWLAESGPAAGVMAAAAAANRSGAARAISCDMGGTSFDVSDMAGEAPSRITRGELMGVWTALPRVDVESIGAGGGSIAWIDARGMLRVGPQSAGSRPGPVCYGHGGTQPTVTDALVVLDYIDAANFLGGDMRLDRDQALAACSTVGAPLGLDAEEAAWGVRAIALAEMTKAVRTRLAMRGLDPRDHALVSFGGCASLFTADIAKALSAPVVIVPAAASVLSALGAATMGMRRERVRSVLKPLPIAVNELAAIQRELADRVDADLAADGIAAADRAISLEADLRFVRQNWELSIVLDALPLDQGFEPALRARFEEEYGQRYGAGSIAIGTPIEIVAIRAVGTGPAANGLAPLSPPLEAPLATIAPSQSRLVRSGTEPGARIRVGLIADEAIGAGQALPGPALIERWDTSIWVPEGVTARRDCAGSIVLEVS
jgi:N-methylhydantoinase A